MATKINVRSPYYVKISNDPLTTVLFELFIWTGAGLSRPASPQYTLTKSKIGSNNYVVFEISELVRDYIDTGYYGSSDVVWVQYRTTIDEGTPVFSSYFLAVEGYGYFHEGTNPELSRDSLISNEVIWRPEDENIKVPVFTDDAIEVVMLNGDMVLRSVTLGPSDETSEMIEYVSVSGDISADNYKQRVLSTGGTYEYNPLLIKVDNYVDINLVDTIRVYRGDSYKKISVRTQQCDKYPDRKITFINKFGALQDIYFFAKEVESMSASSDTFKSNSFSNVTLSYDTTKHQYQQFDKQARERVILNTGFVSDDYNEVITQMMLSEKVWLTKTTDKESNVIPVIPITKDVTYKTSLNDKMVEYAIEFEYAFDKIQNIR